MRVGQKRQRDRLLFVGRMTMGFSNRPIARFETAADLRVEIECRRRLDFWSVVSKLDVGSQIETVGSPTSRGVDRKTRVFRAKQIQFMFGMRVAE